MKQGGMMMHREIAKRCMALLLSICMIAGMVDLSGFTARAAGEKGPIGTITVKTTKTYTGSPIEITEDDIIVADGFGAEIPKTNSAGEANYKIRTGSITNNTNVGFASFTVEGSGDYTGTQNGRFEIVPKDITGANIEVTLENQFKVGTGPVKTTVKVVDKDRGETLRGVEGTQSQATADFTYMFEDNVVEESSPDTLTAKIVITGQNNYSRTRNTDTYTITRRYNNKLTIEFKNSTTTDPVTGKQMGQKLYTGDPITWEKSDVSVKYDGVELSEDEFNLSYGSYKGAITAGEVNAVGAGPEYAGLRSEIPAVFRIVKNIAGDWASYKPADRWKVSIKNQRYTGQPITPDKSDVTITDPDGGQVEDWEWDFGTARNNTNENMSPGAQKATIEIVPTSPPDTRTRYTGTHIATFNIEASRLTPSIIHTENLNFTYDGETDWFTQLETALEVSEGTGDTKTVYHYRTDYTIDKVGSYTSVNAGSYQIKVSTVPGSKLIGAPVTVTFTVQKRNVNDSGIDITWPGEYYDDSSHYGYTYTGTRIEPQLQLKYTNDKGTPNKMEYPKDFTLSYDRNKNINVATGGAVTVTGTGNYTGTRTETFDIKPLDISTGKLTYTKRDYTYNGKDIWPDFSLAVGNNSDLKKDTDYEIQCNVDHKNVADNIQFTIAGKGNYTGSFTDTFNIKPLSIDTDVTIDYKQDVMYTSQPVYPDVTIIHQTTKETLTNNDYDITWPPESTNVARDKEFTITAKGNYTGTRVCRYNIVPCDISKLSYPKLDVYATNKVGETFHFLDGSAVTDRYFAYDKGNQVQPDITVKIDGHGILAKGDDVDTKDFTVSFGTNKEIGPGTATVTGQGNYTGSVPVTFVIKGDLATDDAHITFAPEPYNAKVVTPTTPTMADFAGRPLVLGTDFQVQNRDAATIPVTPVGTAYALVTGIGSYCFGEKVVPFEVRKFDLSIDITEDSGYEIKNIEKEYTYSRLPIQPKPVITHNSDTPLIETNDYTLEYWTITSNGTEIAKIEEPCEVGNYRVKIKGAGANYTGETYQDFAIVPYDIGEGYDKQDPEVIVSGVNASVILDALKETADGTLDGAVWDADSGEITWKDLAVKHIPLDLDQNKRPEETMDPDKDYRVTYSMNDTIGRAEIKITGKSPNYTGDFTVYFQIKGDLANAEIQEIEPWTYTPSKVEGGQTIHTNCPKPTVIYTVEYGDESKEDKKITLSEGTDYTLKYDNNGNATKADKDSERFPGKLPATVEVIATPDDGSVEGGGNYVNTEKKEAEFDILQRDLTYAVGEEGIKDEQLEVTGVEEQYEYTGSEIVPDIAITCAGGEVKKKADDADDAFDYEVSAVNNLNVYHWNDPDAETHTEADRVMPELTVTAKQDENGNFTGNYKGSFKMGFEVTPRHLENEAGTIDTLDMPIKNVGDRDYTGDPIYFPIDEDHPVEVTWFKAGNPPVITPLIEGQDYELAYGDHQKIGEGELLIRAVQFSNYTGVFVKTFRIIATIEAVNPSHEAYGKYINLNYDDNVPYGVTEVFPDLIFTDRSGVDCGEADEPKILEEGTDFEIIRENSTEADPTYGTSKNNINVHTYDTSDPYGETEQPDSPTIVVRGKGYYKGTIRRYYNITPKKLTDEDITVKFKNPLQYEGYENAYEYTGGNIEPQIEVYNGDNLMVVNRDYTVIGYDHNKDLSTDSQKAGVTIASVEGGNYTESRRFEFSIVPTPIARATVTVENASQIYYDRQAKKPAVKVVYGRDTLVEGKDYTLDYGNYVDAATPADEDESKRPTIIVTGIGGYGGIQKVTYTILPENINNQEDIEVTGRAIMRPEGPDIAFTVRAKDGTELKPDIDYTVDAYTGTAGIGDTGTTTIRGIGNYTGTRQAEFRILPPNGTIQIEEIPSEPYNTKPHTPEVKVSLLVDESRFTVNLVEGIDYNVSYDNNLNAGTAQVKVSGLDYFEGKTAIANFEITKKGIGTGLELADSMVFEPIGKQTYTGRGVTPQVKLTYQNAAEEINSQLVVGRDYVISYANNVAVGTATATITGINNYSGSYRTTFDIYGNMNMATVAEIPTQEYTGSPVTPVPVISFGGNKLTEGKDYTLEYKNNIERGTATIVITGLGQYTGTKTITFTIARELSDATSIRGVAASYTYTGSAIVPPVRVEDNGVLLTKGRDYQVSYKDNVNAGTATITVTGIDKYQGSKSVTFKINPQQLGRATVSKIANQTYNGKTLKPAIKVTSGKVTLQNNKDYTVVYVGGEKPGMASVIIKGTGNFTGTQTVNYNIAVPGMSGVKVSKYTDTGITFSWKKNSVVTGYEVYNSKNRREKMITKNGTTKYTVSKLKAGTSYTFRIRAYVRKNGKYYYGPFTTMKTATAPKSTKISSLTSKKSKQVVIKWKKVSKATKYEVYRSTSSKGKYKKLGTTTKTSYTDKKATGGKKYYYKIRVCKTISKTNYYSSYSGAKSIKARK
ncbi:MAG: hypothetical protein HFH41_02880 [Lachnospiraceae bacterium]|nr:hypothetical protein [Lachnospiraceae bacterium]